MYTDKDSNLISEEMMLLFSFLSFGIFGGIKQISFVKISSTV